MYPNPQDVLPIPRAHAGHFRAAVQELVSACRAGEDAVREWAGQWVMRVLEVNPESPDDARRTVGRWAGQIADFAREQLTPPECATTQAELVIARAHGFPTWSALVAHLEGLAQSDSTIGAFERAADAIISGEIAELERLLESRRDLVHVRSDREHRATLLHYVSANGVENYRQKTPPNIVDIARRLLDAGAEVDAEANVYGGGATTLGLVVTSAHPRLAGVQNPLADLLLDRGARLDSGTVHACLMNGCPEAAEHMVLRGAPVNLDGAAGIGRVDLVASYFSPGRVVSEAEAGEAMNMAAWYDRREVIRFLLDHGVDAGTRTVPDGDTALHIASYLGNVSLVELLLRGGAPVDVIDHAYRTPPMVWALHAWLAEGRPTGTYPTVLRMLADAGATVKAEWLEHDRLRAEGDLHAALSRRIVGA